MSRFDYVKYDTEAQQKQENFKIYVTNLEAEIFNLLPQGRAQSEAIDALEVCYMWIGKGLRDGQIARNGSAPLQEERCNS